jgi:hypothetical protein
LSRQLLLRFEQQAVGREEFRAARVGDGLEMGLVLVERRRQFRRGGAGQLRRRRLHHHVDHVKTTERALESDFGLSPGKRFRQQGVNIRIDGEMLGAVGAGGNGEQYGGDDHGASVAHAEADDRDYDRCQHEGKRLSWRGTREARPTTRVD